MFSSLLAQNRILVRRIGDPVSASMILEIPKRFEKKNPRKKLLANFFLFINVALTEPKGGLDLKHWTRINKWLHKAVVYKEKMVMIG